MSSEVVKQLGERYGPYAFGLVSLLVVWYAIVAPTLEINRVDTNAFKELSQRQSETALLLARTAERLDTIAARLERIDAGGR